jgi:hypothetical protein
MVGSRVITDGGPADPFADLDAYLGLPHVGGLWMSPGGSRLVTGVTRANREKNRDVTALWEVDAGPAGLKQPGC